MGGFEMRWSAPRTLTHDDPWEVTNCIWLPRSLQNKNLRKNLRIEFNGRTYNGRELARFLGVSNNTVLDHIRRGNLREWLSGKLAA